MISNEYRVANHVGRFGIMLYGILRLLEDIILKNEGNHGISVIIICIAATTVLAIIQTLMKDSKYVPLVTGLFIMAVFLVSATFLRDFGYYYISMLCIVGIVCIYLNFRNVLIFFLISICVNIPFYFTVFQNKNIANLREMVIDGILFIYGFVFLVILAYRLTIRDTAAQKGLDAFSSLLKTTPNMMIIVDDMRKVSYISHSMAVFADCPIQYAVGRPLLDLFRDYDLKMFFADIIENEGYFEDIRKIESMGETRYYKIVCDKLEGEANGMFIDVADVTATVEAKLEAEREKEIANNANISKSKFLATMSHEIRTPMNAIIGISQMQLGKKGLPSDVVEAIEKIYASGHGLLGIINDILDLSKIETGKLDIVPTAYDLPSLINDTVQLHIARIGSKPIDFSLTISKDIPAKLFGDELRIKQILGNILTNAFKYTMHGSVRMRVSHELIADGVHLIVSISDTGQGMKAEDVAALGNEFARFNLESNRSTEGTGLGMSITKRLLCLMKGRMDIESVYGVGSTFTVTIPQQISDDKIIGAELADRLADFTYSRDKRAAQMQIVRELMPYGKVLVVDDVETNLYVAEGLLRPYEIAVTAVTSGFAAIDLISAGNAFDIIFMDHMMPIMDGIETAEKLRSTGYTAPIVALTANALTGNEELFRQKGFDDFISKPVDIRRLNAVLNRFVRDKNKSMTYTKERIIRTESPTISPKLIEVFLRDVERSIPILRNLGKNDSKLFMTTAHAMKSACANIGNAELSEMAKSLEAAAYAENNSFIEKTTPEFINKLQSFVSQIVLNNENDLPLGDTEFLKIALAKIAVACDTYDSDVAEKLLSTLQGYRWPENTRTALANISKLLLHAEFEEAAKLARNGGNQ
jgi:signal transduction histidine kinase/FixJ family two-component response regulator